MKPLENVIKIRSVAHWYWHGLPKLVNWTSSFADFPIHSCQISFCVIKQNRNVSQTCACLNKKIINVQTPNQFSNKIIVELYRVSLVVQMAKNRPAMQETRVLSLVGKIPWRSKWQPTPVFLPGKPHGQRSLVDCSPLSRKELDTTEQLTHNLNCLEVYSISSLIQLWFRESWDA